MAEWIKRCLLAMVRVPADPVAPEGSADSVRVFRAGKNFYRWQILMWLLANLVILTVLLIVMLPGAAARMPSAVRAAWLSITVFSLVVFLISLPFTYFSRRLNFELRWYIVTDRSLRIRSGIASVREMTMTFANIQELRVKSGPLQKLLGLADLEVRSAGGGSSGPHGSGRGHIGRFEGVDNANFIRDLIADRLRQYKDSGLGEHREAATGQSSLLTEAQNMLSEARALRTSLAKNE